MTVEERLAALEQAWAALQAQTPTNYYTSRHGGEEIDNGIDRAKEGGAIDAALAGKANQTDLRRPNLLDNWYFADPINQREQAEYRAAGYTIDRWKKMAGTGTLVVGETGITLTSETGQGDGHLSYLLEDIAQYKSKTLTLAGLILSGAATKHVEAVCYRPADPGYALFAGNAVSGSGISSITFTVPSDTTGIEVRFAVGGWGSIGSATISAIKLELGSQQTLARKESGVWVLNDPPPNKALEREKCQRYYRRIDRIVTNTGGVTTPYLSVYMNYPDMRANPVFNCHGAIVDGGGSEIAGAVIEDSVFTKNSGVLIKLNKSISTGIVQFLDVSLDANL